MNIENFQIKPWGERYNLLIPGDAQATLDVCVRHFISCCQSALAAHGKFFVALSGGSTPKKIFEQLCAPPHSEQIEWDKVWLFWGDERNVPPTSDESNYKMAMDAGLKNMPIPKEQIFRMQAEEEIEKNGLVYEEQIRSTLKGAPFDLVMLGMGEDGHTASLFPQTEGLKAEGRLAIANYVPQKNTWRMSLTFEAINTAHNIVIYIIGEAKKQPLAEVLKSEEQFERYPIQRVGTKDNKSLWIIDTSAAEDLLKD